MYYERIARPQVYAMRVHAREAEAQAWPRLVSFPE